MKCFNEIQLDVLAVKVLEESFIPPAEWQHLQECPFCKDRFTAARSIYEALPPVPRYSAERFTLKPVALPPPPPVVPQVILAADSGLPEPPRYKKIGVFSTANEDLIIRMMQDRVAKKIMLYLVADEHIPTAHVFVRLVGKEKSWISDSQGVVTVPDDAIPDAESATFQVQAPLVIGPVTLFPSESDRPAPRKYSVSIAGELVPFSLAVRPGKEPQLYDVMLTFPQTWPKVYVALIGPDYLSPPAALNQTKITFSNLKNLENITLHIYS